MTEEVRAGPDAKAKAKLAALVLILVSLSSAVFFGNRAGIITQESIRSVVASGGLLAPLFYVVISSLLVAAWAPRGLLSVLGGVLFGPVVGSVLALAMGCIGAFIGYLMSNRLGHDYVVQRARQKGGRLLDFMQRRGFWAVLACRVCPIVPSELISATSGAAAIPFSHFAAATVLGMAPNSIIYAAFGGSLLDPDAAWVTWGSLAIFALLTLVTGLSLIRLWRNDSAIRP